MTVTQERVGGLEMSDVESDIRKDVYKERPGIGIVLPCVRFNFYRL